MLICKKCGLELLDDEAFCPNCGTPAAYSRSEYAPTGQAAASQYKDPRSEYTVKGRDYTAEFQPEDIAENKTLAVIGYAFPIVTIIASLDSSSKYLKFHGNQALLIALAVTLLALLSLIPIVGIIIAFICINAVFVLQFVGLIFTCQGQSKQLPLIGGITLIKWY